MKMKHTAIQNRQTSLDACGGNLPERNPNLQIFILNQSHSVTLPLVSDKQRLIWVHSNQIDLPPKSVAELSKTFDRFPYLTQKETNALAHRCSLHPDQVKVWFMEQRIRYGISWDFKDIQVVRSKLKSNQKKEELQQNAKKEEKKDGGRKKTRKRKVGTSGGETVEKKCKKEKSSTKGENEERKMTPQQTMKEEKNEKVEKDEKDSEKKKKSQVMETGEMEEEGMKQGETEKQKLVQLTGAELEGELDTMSVNPNYAVTDIDKLKELIEGTDNPSTDSKTRHHKPRAHPRTQAQEAMMRRAFLQCQYPDNEDYIQLSALIGLHRSLLVQWYCDTRYHIKRAHPRWLSKEQHRRMVANIKYRQFLKSVMKTQPAKSDKKIEWEKALHGEATCGKTRSVTL
ncbi:homeobox and leucine zipper encoding b [Halichoeres trimaculatus]|uniref:homeobox and leucine zipper encoding b n=1 Tax=Halichoeres trimaculatus TaxID=147232 RepID=UPI003D9E4D34